MRNPLHKQFLKCLILILAAPLIYLINIILWSLTLIPTIAFNFRYNCTREIVNFVQDLQ
jgi:hypothetical protein